MSPSPASFVGVVLALVTLAVAAVPLVHSLDSGPEGVQSAPRESPTQPTAPPGAALKGLLKYEVQRQGLAGGGKPQR